MTRDEIKYTRIVRKHDEKLFVRENRQTKVLDVFREHFEHEVMDISDIVGEDSYYSAVVPQHHYIMSLTDNWNSSGHPAPWGENPLRERLGEIDAWNPESHYNKIDEINAKVDKSKQRDFDNQTEAFAYEFRDSFKETFKDVNTASMEKIDKRKLKEKK